MKKKIIFWDIGNVLFKIRTADFLKAVITAGRQKETNQRRLDEIITRSFRGRISFSRTIDELVNITRCSRSTVMEIMKQDWVIPNRELMKYVHILSSECHQGIISDMWHVPYFWICRDYKQFLKIFDDDKVFFSHLAGLTKKEDGKRNLIGRALRTCSLLPSDACMIDDDVDLIQATSEIGMHAIHFPRRRLVRKHVNWKFSNEVVVNKLREEFLTP